MPEGTRLPAAPVRPRVLSMRERSEVTFAILQRRLDTVLPAAMREAGLDVWLVLCQEDDLDPIFRTMMPMNTWFPILQILVFHDRGDGGPVERICLAGTNTHGLYEQPLPGQRTEPQWRELARIVADRDPGRIGINIGSVQWAAGGLTHNLYLQLCAALGERYVARLRSAEPAAVHWLATLVDEEIVLYEHLARLAHVLLAECYSRATIVPGVTTVSDLEWAYWEKLAELALEPSFKPYFNLVRSADGWERWGHDDDVIRPGDLIHSDVGFRYLGLVTDHQEWAYVLRPGESAAPEGFTVLMAEGNRLQDIFMSSFEPGLTGDELLQRILSRAREEGVPGPRVYSHSLGHLLHEPGPLIGLPWEQERNPGRGDVRLEYDTAFTMELSVRGPVPEWGGEELTLSLEQDVVYTREGCRVLDGRQTAFHLV